MKLLLSVYRNQPFYQIALFIVNRLEGINQSTGFSVRITCILYEMCGLGKLANRFFGLFALFVCLKKMITCGCEHYIEDYVKYLVQCLT